LARSRHLPVEERRRTTDVQPRERFERLYTELMPRVLGYAMRRVDPEEARDAVAETFTVAWRRLHKVPEGDAALPWLLVTTRNVLANRRRKSRPELVGPEAAVPDHADDVAASIAFVSAFNRLSERDRETLALVAWDGLEPSEAARVAGCSSTAFGVRLHRARRRLAALLENDDDRIGTRTEGTA
jgi:RNA polymerase sigma-70 factor (ECF subfamily)